MSSKVNELMVRDGASVFYSEAFRRIIEDHLPDLKSDSGTQGIQIKNEVAHKAHGDFYMVLDEYDIPVEHQWIILRMNGYTHPSEYRTSHVVMLVPSKSVIDGLMKTYRANQKISAKRKK